MNRYVEELEYEGSIIVEWSSEFLENVMMALHGQQWGIGAITTMGER